MSSAFCRPESRERLLQWYQLDSTPETSTSTSVGLIKLVVHGAWPPANQHKTMSDTADTSLCTPTGRTRDHEDAQNWLPESVVAAEHELSGDVGNDSRRFLS